MKECECVPSSKSAGLSSFLFCWDSFFSGLATSTSAFFGCSTLVVFLGDSFLAATLGCGDLGWGGLGWDGVLGFLGSPLCSGDAETVFFTYKGKKEFHKRKCHHYWLSNEWLQYLCLWFDLFLLLLFVAWTSVECGLSNSFEAKSKHKYC